jgi:hypothetical protein
MITKPFFPLGGNCPFLHEHAWLRPGQLEQEVHEILLGEGIADAFGVHLVNAGGDSLIAGLEGRLFGLFASPRKIRIPISNHIKDLSSSGASGLLRDHLRGQLNARYKRGKPTGLNDAAHSLDDSGHARLGDYRHGDFYGSAYDAQALISQIAAKLHQPELHRAIAGDDPRVL